jgi:tetratricopeptide (TPR) repeat protein
VDTQTRHALKQDKLIHAATTSADWLSANRELAVRLLIVGAVVLAAIIAGLVIYNQRSNAAELALGQAMDIYNTALAQPGQPDTPGTASFPSTAARAKAANERFADIAKRYSHLEAGTQARYFAGLTFMEMGQNGNAENALEEVVRGHNSELGALAKLALASLYEQTGRSPQAVALYKQLIAKPTSTVPADAAQLQLAALYETTDPAQAKRIYAQLKNDKTAAGQIAAEKLAPAAK